MGAPPVSSGLVHDATAPVLRGCALTMVGGSGWPMVLTGADGAEGGPSPPEVLAAVTVTVYSARRSSPSMVHVLVPLLVAATVQVAPSGEAVAL